MLSTFTTGPTGPDLGNESVLNIDLYNLQCTLTAHQQGYDVVLVDTAGRMQDNEPLMRSLAKVGLQLHFAL